MAAALCKPVLFVLRCVGSIRTKIKVPERLVLKGLHDVSA